MGKIGTSINKTVVGIATIVFFLINGMEHDQCRQATSIKIKLALIHVLLQ
jgi:hypothetical protein